MQDPQSQVSEETHRRYSSMSSCHVKTHQDIDNLRLTIYPFTWVLSNNTFAFKISQMMSRALWSVTRRYSCWGIFNTLPLRAIFLSVLSSQKRDTLGQLSLVSTCSNLWTIIHQSLYLTILWIFSYSWRKNRRCSLSLKHDGARETCELCYQQGSCRKLLSQVPEGGYLLSEYIF